jgi:hypothetical protein
MSLRAMEPQLPAPPEALERFSSRLNRKGIPIGRDF